MRFPGQYYDSETGLHYNWHRYYDTSTGRYLRVDPIGFAGGINPFLYAEVNPVMFIDPYGLLTYSQPYSSKHRDRNKHNVCPRKKPTDDSCGVTRDHLGNEWSKDDVSASKIYHGYNEGCRTFRGLGKFTGSQCVYDVAGNLIDSGKYMGTYDYSPPRSDSPEEVINHYYEDVLPHDIGRLFGIEYTPNLTTTY